MAWVWNNLGELKRMKGEWNQAINLYLKSLEIKEQAGDQRGMATTYMNLGSVHLLLGRLDQAIAFYAGE